MLVVRKHEDNSFFQHLKIWRVNQRSVTMTKHPRQSIYKEEIVVWAPGFRPPWRAWLLWDLFWDRHPDKWVTDKLFILSCPGRREGEGGREHFGVSSFGDTNHIRNAPRFLWLHLILTTSQRLRLQTVLSSIQVFLEKVLGIKTPGIRYAPKSILNVSVIRTIKYYVQINHAVQND